MDIMTELKAFAKLPIYEQVRILVEECNEEAGDGLVPCDACKGKGYIYIQDGTEYHKERCRCADSRDALKRIMRLGYLDVCQRSTFEKFDAYDETMAAVKEICRNYATHPEGWLYLGGQSGFGKTHLAWAMFGTMIRKHRSPRVMLWIQDAAAIKRMTNDPEYDRVIETLQDADVLIIDDLFNTRPTDADVKLARTILDYRYVNNLPTIITTEYTLEQLSTWDDAIAGRIAERCGKYHAIQVAENPARNYRLRFLK